MKNYIIKDLNLDGFEEKTIITESACFYDIILNLDYIFEKKTNKNLYKIKIEGMPGRSFWF